MSPLPLSSLSIDRGPDIIRILTPLAVVVTFFVGLRITVRIRLGVGLDADDYLVLLSLVLCWGLYVLAVTFVQFGGLGRPLAVNLAMDPQRILIAQKILFSSEFLYPSALVTTKLSILSMYHRIFPTRFMKNGKLIVGLVTIAWWIAYVLVDIVQCQPIAKILDKSIPGYCIPLYDFFLGSSIPNIITDVVILCLPLHEISKLHLPRGSRAALAGIFLLGAGVTAVSGVRLWYHVGLAEKGANADLTLDFYNPVLWTIIEPDLAIICACLPVLGPLLRSFINSFLMQPIRSSRKRNRDEEETPNVLRTFVSIGGSRAWRMKPRNDRHNMTGLSLESSEHLHYINEDIELSVDLGDDHANAAIPQLSSEEARI
ncbi:hypothetical protein EV127DRAFT_488356 [Xylaria flabelliformis]|nr:hypothetical protein EV127DRAFT_488356 [Xylaria flabelliformis]